MESVTRTRTERVRPAEASITVAVLSVAPLIVKSALFVEPVPETRLNVSRPASSGSGSRAESVATDAPAACPV